MLMLLHREDAGGIYIPAAETYDRVKRAIGICGNLPLLKRGVMICDTGVEPNEDDLAEIMMVTNLNLLAQGNLKYNVTHNQVHAKWRREFPDAQLKSLQPAIQRNTTELRWIEDTRQASARAMVRAHTELVECKRRECISAI